MTTTDYIDKNELKRYITDRVFEVAKRIFDRLSDGSRPNDPEHHQPCIIAGCDSNDDGFRFYPAQETFHCRKCGFNGDIFALVQKVFDVDFPDDLSIVANAAGYVGCATKTKKTTGAKTKTFRDGTVKKTEYIYTDEEGNPRHKIVRLDGIEISTGKRNKTCYQLKFQDGKWGKGAPDITYPYCLPELLQVTTIVFVEGEKAADCVNRVFFVAGSETTIATTSPMGAQNGHLWKEYLQRYPDIAEKRIIILPDDDEPGRKFAHTVAAIFFEAKANVKIIELPGLPKGGDFVDWCDAMKANDKDESAIIKALKALYKSAERVTAEDVAKWKQDEAEKKESTPKIKLTCLTDIEDRKQEWFMHNKIPANDISVISGGGGCGKTYFTCYLAAHVTNGSPFPDGHPCEMGNVVFFPPEGQRTGLKRRLVVNGVDLQKCFILEGTAVFDKKTKTWVLDPIALADCSRLEEAIDEAERLTGYQTILLIIDPVMSFVGKRNPNYDNEVRQLLTPLQSLADRRKITIILVAHHGKAEHSTASNQTSGSVAWVNVPRSVWQVYRDKEDKDLRYFAPAKANDCIDPKTIAFRIVSQPGHDEGRVEIVSMDITKTADDFMNEQRKAARCRVSAALNGNDGATDEEAEEIILEKIRRRDGEATVTDLQRCIKQRSMKKYFKADALERKLREMIKKGILTVRYDGRRAVEYFGIPLITEEK